MIEVDGGEEQPSFGRHFTEVLRALIDSSSATAVASVSSLCPTAAENMNYILLLMPSVSSLAAAGAGAATLGTCSRHHCSARSLLHRSARCTSESRRHRSSADRGRPAGSFARHDETARSSASGMGLATSRDGGAGSVLRWWSSTVIGSPVNTGLPVSSQ